MLAHVAHGYANEAYVGALLDQAPWPDGMAWLRRRDFPVRRKKEIESCTPARAALSVLYGTRDDFLHGNAVSWDTLVSWGPAPTEGRVSIPTGAAVLYRIALRSFLVQHGWTTVAAGGDASDPFDGMELFDDMAAGQALRVMLLGRDAADAEDA